MEYTIIIQGYTVEPTEEKTLEKAHRIGENALEHGALHYKVVSIGSDLCWDSRDRSTSN
jgi:hypothetical protein